VLIVLCLSLLGLALSCPRNSASAVVLKSDLNSLIKINAGRDSFRTLLIDKYKFELVTTSARDEDYVRDVPMVLTGGFSQKEWLRLKLNEGKVTAFELEITRAAF
jgi:hypothetical protein